MLSKIVAFEINEVNFCMVLSTIFVKCVWTLIGVHTVDP